MKRTFLLVALVTAFLAIGASAQQNQRSDSRKQLHNVLLIIGDDHGLEMGAYGNQSISTPNLDKLAAMGTLFTNGFATVSSCSSSRSVLYSGLYSHSNGMYGLAHAVHNQHLLPWVVTLPALLKEHGYSSCLVGKKHILPAESLPFDEELAEEVPGKSNVSFMANEAEKYMKSHEHKSFLLVVAFSDPHRADKGFDVGESNSKQDYTIKDVVVPTHLPDLIDVRKDLVEYYKAISRMDYGVGLVLDKLKSAGLEKNTLVIYLSDNGRPFPGAKTTLYDEGIHLPLIVKSPEQVQHGLKNDGMVSWIDIVPTILDWTGTKGPNNYALPGRSLLPILEQEHPNGWDKVFASHCFHEIDQYYPMRAVRTKQYEYIANLAWQLPYPLSSDIRDSLSWKAIQASSSRLGERSLKAFFNRPEEELYDVIKDPNEVSNLAANPSHKQVLEQLRAQVERFRKDTKDPWHATVPASGN